MTIIKPFLNLFRSSTVAKAVKTEAKVAKQTSNFVNEYYQANKGLPEGPFMSTQDKLEQIVWRNFHAF